MPRWNWSLAHCAPCVLALLLLGCGSGTIAIIALSSGGSSGSDTVVSNVILATPPDGQSGRVPLQITVTADPGRTVNLVGVEYALDGSDGEFHPASAAAGFPTTIAPDDPIRG